MKCESVVCVDQIVADSAAFADVNQACTKVRFE